MDEDKQFYTYIMTNKKNTVLYTGITNDLERRVFEHKNKIIKGFTSKYNIDKLVYYEIYPSAFEAITREKQIKAGSRQKKLNLIIRANANFSDLAAKWFWDCFVATHLAMTFTINSIKQSVQALQADLKSAWRYLWFREQK